MTKHNTKRYEVLEELRKDPMASIRKLGIAVGIKSTANVIRHLKKLEQEGLIIRERYVQGVIITGSSSNMVTMPSKKVNRKYSRNYYKQTQKGGRAGRGVDAFHARVPKHEPDLDKRIDQVVAKAKAKEAEGEATHGEDAIRHISLPLFLNGRCGAVKIG